MAIESLVKRVLVRAPTIFIYKLFTGVYKVYYLCLFYTDSVNIHKRFINSL